MIVNSTPYIMEVAPPQDRHNIFAIQQASLGLFGFAGSLAAVFYPVSWRDSPVPQRIARLLSGRTLADANLLILGAVLLLRRTQPLRPVREEAKSNYDAAMPLFLIVFVGVIVFLQTAGEGTIRVFFNVYLDTNLQVSTSRIGVVMGIGQFLPIVSSLAAPLVIAAGDGTTIVAMGVVSSRFMFVMAYFANWGAASAGEHPASC